MERTERRRFIRLEVPIELRYNVMGAKELRDVTTKDISCDGVRFVAPEPVNVEAKLALTIKVPKAKNPVHAEGKVVWARRQSTGDPAVHEVGLELVKIEEDNKNTFLKYLCDIIYAQTKKIKSRTKTNEKNEKI